MKTSPVFLFVLCLVRFAVGEVSLRICEADGVTPFTGGTIMAGTKLTLIVHSEVGGYWNGGLFIAGQNRAYGILSARDFDPNTEDWTGSRLEAAGEQAMVTSYRDSWMWGFDLCTDSEAEAGDWFIVDYTAVEMGDPNVGFYEYQISWDDPNFVVNFYQVPTRDFNGDEVVNLFDYAILSTKWLLTGCEEPNWCDRTDIDRDGQVDITDLALFTDFWLWESPGRIETMQRGGDDPNQMEDEPDGEKEVLPDGPAYIITVGRNPAEKDPAEAIVYDFDTINGAIEAMRGNRPDATRRGSIRVYPGIYDEQINSFYPGSYNLPAHCDLIGMGTAPSEVVIRHKRRSENDPAFTDIVSEIYAYGLKAEGDNLISNLTVRNDGPNQNSVLFVGAGRLDRCEVYSDHDAVTAWGHLVMNGGTIRGKYRPCVHAFGTFEIADCTLYPATADWGGQHPAGIKVTHSGTVDNVIIRAEIASSDYEPHYDTPWLAGVIVQLTHPDDVVVLRNITMDLTLKTLYHDKRPDETATWQLFGVVSGGRNPAPTTYYPGKTIIEDCRINLVGIEDSSNPNGDGRGIMVAGACIQGGGVMEIRGNTILTTSRTTARYAADGYEYSLNNKNGTLLVECDTVEYDSKKTHGVIQEK